MVCTLEGIPRALSNPIGEKMILYKKASSGELFTLQKIASCSIFLYTKPLLACE